MEVKQNIITIICTFYAINIAVLSNWRVVDGVFVSTFRSEPHVCRFKVCPVGHRCVASPGQEFVDCVCDHRCSQTKETGPVCAEGRTYANLCQLRMKICQERRNILVSNYGECSGCRDAERESKAGLCKSWAKANICMLRPSIMTVYCKKTCGYCKQQFPTQRCGRNTVSSLGCNRQCHDLRFCKHFALSCGDKMNMSIMRLHCPQTCGYCVKVVPRPVLRLPNE